MMDTETPPESIRTVKAALETKAESLGEATFFHYRGKAYSYADVERKANAIANELAATGVRQGDTVCISLYNAPEYLYTLFALAKLGAVAAPIDTRFAGNALAYVLSATGADTIILDDDTRPTYERVREGDVAVTTEYFVGDASDHPYRDFSQLLDGDSSSPPAVNVSGSDTFANLYIQRDTMERPKGVLLPHYSFINTGWETAVNIFEFSPDDCIFTTLPMYSSYPIQVGVMGALMANAEFAFAKQFRPDEFWASIDEYDATAFLYLGRMLSVLLNRDETPTEGVNQIELAIGHGFGFDTDEELIAEFEERFDITVLEGYGTTPTATVATFNYPGERKVGSVGRPVSYMEVEIVDDDDWPVPAGDIGEIVVRSTRPHTLMQRFHDDSEATVDAWQNNWLHTGDIGYLDEDGYLYFVAREENSIQLGRVAGRISTLEVESVIDTHPAVAESVVLAETNALGEEEIKAVVVPEADADPSPVDICRYCERQLAYVKVPRFIEIRDGLPRSRSGKIQKDELTSTSRDDIWDREQGYELCR